MSHSGLDLTDLDLTSRDTRLKINNDLQTISQVFYLVNAQLLSHQTQLKALVQLGQSALLRVADACARPEERSSNTVSGNVARP